MKKLLADYGFETMVRFLIGGATVVTCYLISMVIPIKIVAGLFAAFPAIMSSSVALTGKRDGNEMAGEVAKGAVSGMIGCAFSVIAVLLLIKPLGNWYIAAVLSVPVWFAASLAVNRIKA